MRRTYLYILLLITVISCNEKKAYLACERIDYLISTKQHVAKEYWSDFSEKTLYGPMLYYTKKGLYTVNANQELNSRITILPADCKSQSYNVGFVPEIVDTSKFHMNVSYDGQDSTVLYYKNTLAMFSDVELTEKFIPDVKDTEEWMSMVIHETFHQYQRSFEKFRDYQVESQKDFGRDTLTHFYKELDWFRQSILKENGLLLAVINETDKEKIKEGILDYLGTKNTRVGRLKNEFGIDILPLENTLSRSEGTARYIEYCVKKFLKTGKSNAVLKTVDSSYIDNKFKDYTLDQDKWMYTVGSVYCYSVGFNLTRVCQKLDINYQKNIFLENKSFDYYLTEYSK